MVYTSYEDGVELGSRISDVDVPYIIFLDDKTGEQLMADDIVDASFSWHKVGTELTIDYDYSDIVYTIETLTKDILVISHVNDSNYEGGSEYYEEVALSLSRVQ